MSRNFYVYVMFRPNGIPCYIGKGMGGRIDKMHRKYNSHLERIIKKAGGVIPTVKIRQHLSEAEAFAIEAALIRALGRIVHGGPLVNQTDGGGGASGHRHSPDTLARLRAINTGRKHLPETLEKMRRIRLSRPPATPEFLVKMSIINASRHPASPRHRSLLSAASTGRVKSPEEIAKIRAAATGHIHTKDARAKMSAQRKGKPKSLDHRAKIAASQRGRPKPHTVNHPRHPLYVRGDQPLEAFR